MCLTPAVDVEFRKSHDVSLDECVCIYSFIDFGQTADDVRLAEMFFLFRLAIYAGTFVFLAVNA